MRKKENYFLLGFTALVIIGLIIANFMGKSQDKEFSQEALNFAEMASALQDGQYEKVLEKSISLEKHQSRSELYNYTIGIAEANLGDVEKSVRHFQRILDINPHKVEDSMFMLQYARILAIAEKKDEARTVLERCASLPAPDTFPEYQEMVVQLEKQLDEQS